MLHVFIKNHRKFPKKKYRLHYQDEKKVQKMNHTGFKEKTLLRKGVNAEHKSLEPEFTLLREMVLARQSAGLSQAQIAERMGTKPPAITRLESSLTSGKHSPSLATIKKYAEAAGYNLEIRLVHK